MSQVYRHIIANKVKQLRLASGMTMEELSLKLGLDNSYISKLENGNMNITIDGLEEIANIFNVEPDYFLNAN